MLRPSKAIEKRERGAVSVETAFAAVVLVGLITATMDFANMHYKRSALQHAVSQATRFAVTGKTVADPNDASKQLSREASIYQLVKQLSKIEDFGSRDLAVYVVNSDGTLTAGPGGPGDVIMVRATYRVGLVTPGLSKLFPNGQYSFTCSTRFRNEEFSSAALGLPNPTRELT
jgi:Flp pilus assembly protein TadG